MSDTSSSQDFYRDLPTMHSLTEVTQSGSHAEVPENWWVVVADVVGSTKAIEAGAYKSVNTVGVACIAAMVNIDKSVDLPFVFGGDGATFAIPETLREPAIRALRGAQQLAREGFGLTLRAGLVPVADLVSRGHRVRMAKVRLSRNVTQPALSGRGWEEAERRVKTANAPGVTRVEEKDGPAEANFEGFECRWQGVPCFQDHKLALIVAAISADADANLATYQRVFDKIDAIYGDVPQYHPLRADRLRLTFDPGLLSHEWRVRSLRFNPFKRACYFLRMLLENLSGRILIALHKVAERSPWSRYPDELVENSDFRKFDGMLRMVMDGSDIQSNLLQDFLHAEHISDSLAFGMHKSREALVTCIVESYTGKHMHFVDGSDGGYALAALELKRRLKASLQRRAGSGSLL